MAASKEGDMTEQVGTRVGADFKDRTTGLIVFGILQIIIGGICALMAPMMILGALITSVAGPTKGIAPMTAAQVVEDLNAKFAKKASVVESEALEAPLWKA